MSNLKKSILLLMVGLCLLTVLSAVSATDLDGVSYDAPSSINTSAVGNFDELKADLESLDWYDHYTFDKDYCFDALEENSSVPVIIIAGDGVSIDGNGHTVDGGNLESVFYITGRNVLISDLHFTNFNNALTSAVLWYGNDGSIYNCTFENTIGYNGGAINWKGDKGCIKDCIFSDNIALKRGGAIFIGGDNGDIINSVFRDPLSPLGREAIYMENKNGMGNELRVTSCDFRTCAYDYVHREDGCRIFIDNIAIKTFDEVCRDLETLNPGDVYNIESNYVITNPWEDLRRNRIININADNVTINGNGYTIDANKDKGYFAVFKITGNNVIINDLNIVNAEAVNYEYSISRWNSYGDDYVRVVSPVEWLGDNGVINNCKFISNVGEEGGAIYWLGNNGKIVKCSFEDNTAARGGAVFIGGNNNTISGCYMQDSYSNYLDVIFLKNYNENGETLTLNLDGCYFGNHPDNIKEYRTDGACVVMKGDEVISPIMDDEEITSDGSYDELREIFFDLKDGDVVNLTKDYYFDYNSHYYPITAHNVTVNGNGHRIYGTRDFTISLIWVRGDNVTVTGIVFDFNQSSEHYSYSYVEWEGDNGVLTNCTFIGNYARTGGAVSWTGSNGVIDGCLFVNNTADVAAGSIYIKGKNNVISNSLFLGSASGFFGDAIFLDYKRRNLTLENVLFDNPDNAVFDEGLLHSHIDVDDIINNPYYRWIGGMRYEVTSLIYNSIIYGGMNYLDDGSYYYSTFYNESGDFVFTFTSKRFAQYNIDYSQSYYFKGIYNSKLNNIFKKLWDNDYETQFTLVDTVYVSSEEDYYAAMFECFMPMNLYKVFEDLEWDYDNANNLAEKDPLLFVLNVEFTRAVSISNCRLEWDMKLGWFPVININGNGSYIAGSFDDNEEEKWVVLGENNVLAAKDLTIAGFNTAVENMGGQCIFQAVTFKNNAMDYIIYRDWGAAILNTGFITCINCKFLSNSAKNGGAIFNQGLLVLQDCEFSGNHAYGEGNDVCVGKNGQVIVDGVEITQNGQSSVVYIAESMSLETATIIAAFTAGIAFIAGTVVGLITANPIIGAAVGFAVGAAIGVGGAAIIISNTYDVNYNRLQCVLTLAFCSAISGSLGGAWGGFVMSYVFAVAQEIGMDAIMWTPITAATIFGITVPSLITGIIYYNTND